ncbi:hypothetical protein GCM10023188_28530 [Pontibacter saemangeumensis]|uniref:DUF551 domain-containing protein n=1 Tax=Pontibacter saemangeumensis TaxID=1084525 RepID=A0ABP8LT90_9BACT
MTQWTKATDKKPELKQQILATIVESGKTKVVPCWYVEGNRIMLYDTPNTQTFSFSLVQAWQPFPEPYEETEQQPDDQNNPLPSSQNLRR